MTSSAETVVWSNRMQAFGESTVEEDPDGNAISISLNVRFPGQYNDEESPFYQNMNREYDPALGRYLQSDPIGQQVAENSYAYASLNSLMFIDPAGLKNSGIRVGRPWPTLPWRGGRRKPKPYLPGMGRGLGDRKLGDAMTQLAKLSMK